MTEDQKAALLARYHAAAHAMQSGVLMSMNAFAPSDGHSEPDMSPKHLRSGINSAMVETGALAKLLLAKGVFTEEEYLTALAEGMEAEAKLYEDELSERFGKKVTLG